MGVADDQPYPAQTALLELPKQLSPSGLRLAHLDACSGKSKAVPRKQPAPIEAPYLTKARPRAAAKRRFGGKGRPKTGRKEAGLPAFGHASNEGPAGTAKWASKTAPTRRPVPVRRIFLGPLWWPPETCLLAALSGQGALHWVGRVTSQSGRDACFSAQQYSRSKLLCRYSIWKPFGGRPERTDSMDRDERGRIRHGCSATRLAQEINSASRKTPVPDLRTTRPLPRENTTPKIGTEER